MKLSTTGEVIGSFLQDRAVAIAGRLGPGPRMIPVTMTLESARAPKRTFHFELANDQMFTPLMAAAAMTSTLASYERQYGTATFYLRGTAKVTKHDAVTFDNVFAGDQPSVNAATYVAAPIAALLGNDFEKVDIESVDLAISSTEETRTATLERVWLDDPRPRAGRTVALKALLRTYRGEEIIQTVPIEIPANVTGAVSVLVADGGRLAQIEQRETRSGQPRSVDQIIRTLNKSRRRQHALREAARLRARRGHQGRGADVTAALGARRARSRPQRRQLQLVVQHDARRVAGPDGSRDQRLARFDDCRLSRLISTPS